MHFDDGLISSRNVVQRSSLRSNLLDISNDLIALSAFFLDDKSKVSFAHLNKSFYKLVHSSSDLNVFCRFNTTNVQTINEYESVIQQVDVISFGDDELVFTFSTEGGLTIWSQNRSENLEEVVSFDVLNFFPFSFSTPSEDKQFLLVTKNKDFTLDVWHRLNNDSFSLIQKLPYIGGEVVSVILKQINNDCFLITAGIGTSISIFKRTEDGSFEDFQLLDSSLILNQHSLGFTSLMSMTVNHDEFIVGSGSDCSIVLWIQNDLGKFTFFQRLEGHNQAINSIVPLYLNNDYFMISASNDRTARVWKRNVNGHFYQYEILAGHYDDVRSAFPMIIDNNTYLVTLSSDETSKVWKLFPDGYFKDFQTLSGHIKKHDSNVLVQMKHSYVLFTASFGNDVLVWELQQEGYFKIIQTIKGHEEFVWDVDYLTKDDTISLVTVAEDFTLKCWDQFKLSLDLD